MADSEDIPTESKEQIGAFDPSKKKKKKKVKAVDEEGDADISQVSEKLEDLSVSEAAADSDFGALKKKKKKKKPVDGSLGEDVGGEAENKAEEIGEPTGEEGDEEGVSSSLLKKKKKKKKDRSLEDELVVEEPAEDEEPLDKEVEEEEEEEALDEEEAAPIDLAPTLPWEGTDRDYLYEELLDRVVNILRANNPELAGTKRRTTLRPPQVLREGTKKTVFVNFMDLCRTMHRQAEHVMAFLLAELGTSGSLDGQQRLVVKGRFAPKNFEGILRRYVNEYVMCGGCKSPDTILHKENRLFFLRCEQCGSHRSVAPIKAGFVARVGRRKAEA